MGVLCTWHTSIISKIMFSETTQNRAKALFQEAGFNESINFSTAETFFSAMLDVMSKLIAQVKELKDDKENPRNETNMKEVTSKSLVNDSKSAKCQLKAHEDKIDALHQYSMKGNFIITTTNDSVPKNLEGSDYIDKLIVVIEEAYDVKIAKDEVTACHRLGKDNSHIIRFGNRRPDSSYYKLSEAVKTGGIYGTKMREFYKQEEAWANKRTNKGPKPTKPEKPKLFCNYQLTAKRAAITKQLRSLKFDKKIANYYTDANGKISMKLKKDGPKIYLTFDWNKESKTVNPAEIEDLYIK